MTDLISSLADSILALINEKPQSPTKAEIEHLLIAIPALKDAYRVECNRALNKRAGLNVPDEALQTNAEQLAKALREHQAKYTVPTQMNTSCLMRGEHTWGVHPLSGSATTEARCIYCGEKPTSVTATDEEFRTAAEQIAEALKASSAQFAEKMERRAVEIFNDLPTGSVCCPNTVTGEHRWYGYDAKGLVCQAGSEWDKGGPYNCYCGAIKP